MKNTDSTRDTTTDHSSPSNPNSHAAGPSYGFPFLAAAIMGLTTSSILAGPGFASIGFFIGMPLLFITCGVYAMYIIPRVAGLVPPRSKPHVGIRTRHGFRSILRGLAFGYTIAAILWLAIYLTENESPIDSQNGPGESVTVILFGGIIAFVLFFFFVRYFQLRGIENYQRIYGFDDKDEYSTPD